MSQPRLSRHNMIGGAGPIAHLGPPAAQNAIVWIVGLCVAFELLIWIGGAATVFFGLNIRGGLFGRIEAMRFLVVDYLGLYAGSALGLKNATLFDFRAYEALCLARAVDCEAYQAYWSDLPPLPLQPWRLLTHQVLHGGLLHLAMNAFALMYVGPPVLRRMGSLRFVAFFAVCGIAGGLGFALLRYGIDVWPALPVPLDARPWTGGITPLVGASGAIFGIWLANARVTWGQLRRMAPEARSQTPQKFLIQWTVLVGGLNLALAVLPTQIAGEAHIGGAIAGFLLARLFYAPAGTYRQRLLTMVWKPFAPNRRGLER